MIGLDACQLIINNARINTCIIHSRIVDNCKEAASNSRQMQIHQTLTHDESNGGVDGRSFESLQNVSADIK